MRDDPFNDPLQRIKDENLEKILPRPKQGEQRKQFVARCMGSSAMAEEFPDEDQRLAVCNSQVGK